MYVLGATALCERQRCGLFFAIFGKCNFQLQCQANRALFRLFTIKYRLPAINDAMLSSKVMISKALFV